MSVKNLLKRTHILLFLFLLLIPFSFSIEYELSKFSNHDCVISPSGGIEESPTYINEYIGTYGNNNSLFDNNYTSYIGYRESECVSLEGQIYLLMSCSLNHTFYSIKSVDILTNPSKSGDAANSQRISNYSLYTALDNGIYTLWSSNFSNYDDASNSNVINIPNGFNKIRFFLLNRFNIEYNPDQCLSIYSSEINITGDDNENYYPSISNVQCDLRDFSATTKYECYANATDIENDTLYYAVDCGDSYIARYFDFVYDANDGNNQTNYLFDTNNNEFLGEYNTVFNTNHNCDFPKVLTDGNAYAYNISHDNCDADKHADLESEMSLSFIMKKIPSLYDLNYFTQHSSEIFLNSGEQLTVDYKESLLNPWSSKLVFNVSKNGTYHIRYSVNNYTSGYQNLTDVDARYIRLEVEFFYDTQKFGVKVYAYNNTIYTSNDYPPGTLVYSSSYMDLGSGANVYDYNYAVKYYTEKHNSSAYLIRNYAYVPSHPEFTTTQVKECLFPNEGIKNVIFYVSDSYHGKYDYSNYDTYSFEVQKYVPPKEFDNLIEQLSGESYDDLQKAFSWGMLILFVLVLFFSYKANNELTEGSFVAAFFICILVSIPLMWFGVLPKWFIIIDGIIIAFGAMMFFRTDRRGG